MTPDRPFQNLGASKSSVAQNLSKNYEKAGRVATSMSAIDSAEWTWPNIFTLYNPENPQKGDFYEALKRRSMHFEALKSWIVGRAAYFDLLLNEL